MLFNSYEFIFFFLPLSFFIYFYLLQKRLIVGARGFLLFASLFFYSWWNINYLPIILSSILFNYIIGNYLNDNLKNVRIHKISLLTFGIIVNVSLLGYFKYSDFFIENFNIAFDNSLPLIQLSLPLAISFFTFQQVTYLVDSYRGETSEYDFLNYALFVTFFPQLIAGPIVHHAEMMPQFRHRKNLVKNYNNIAVGLFIFSIGLFKKTVIADTFSQWAISGFDTAPVLNFFEAWGTSLSYTFQLYFDFSGYTDMAIGAALLFNIKLPVNFNSPYKALDIQDFWRRWHITLSRLLTTFIIGGIWHGAGWTFIFWGFLHGIALVVHRIWKEIGYTLPKGLAWFITFNFVNITWVFFRAENWGDTVKVLKGMAGFSGLVVTQRREELLSFLSFFEWISFGKVTQHIGGGSDVLNAILAGFIITLFFKNSFEIASKKEFKIYHAIFVSVTILCFYFMSMEIGESPFLYFNF
jgi:D-alanyl-lipoteichoic acid acyltransferase DltB (MBOAT superfamily)